MHSPLERTAAGESRLGYHGVLLAMLVQVLLCAASLCASPGMQRIGPRTGDSMATGLEFAAANPADRTVAAHAPVALGEPGEEREKRFTPATEGEGAVDEGEASEPSEEIGETPASRDSGRIASKDATHTPRRPDPIVDLCCVRVTPTRAPPAAVRTVR